jgi:hypothetical protein
VSAAALDATDTAGTDLNALRGELSDLKETLAKLVSQAGNEVAKSAREIGGRVSLAASGLAKKARTLLPLRLTMPKP